MESLQTILFVLQVLVALALIGFILIQHGKGADAGAAFGSGASSTVFGSQGSGNFLSRATTVLAFVFLANSLTLGYIATERVKMMPSIMEQGSGSIMQEESIEIPVTEEFFTEEAEIPESDVPVIPQQ